MLTCFFKKNSVRIIRNLMEDICIKKYLFCAPIIITEEDTKEYYKYINNCDYDSFAEFLRQRSKLEMDTLVSLFKMKYNIPMDETPEVFKENTRKRIQL